MMTLAAIVAGFILDLILGDPKWLPHPICLIGNFISFLEKSFRKVFGFSNNGLFFGGLLMVIIVVTVSFLLPYGILHAAQRISPALAFFLETFMCYQIFATKSLRDESLKVYYALKKDDLSDARKKLSWIVGRDTENLTPEEIGKAAVETVAENTADGIIAPMFYMFFGGAPPAFLYKGINTMDSMVGYRNEKYLYFGRCAAKLDDIANLLPSRITACIMIIAAYFLNLDAVRAWKTFCRDRYNHLSLNSAMTESVAAGALNIQLGGGHYYFGQWVHKDTIGDNLRPVRAEDIVVADNLLYMTAVITLLLFSLIYLIIILF
ncbi:MAG: adenosylcobinamide-phosphate synthase CbiB, partial [Phascolarctobacterium sp.]|nr:adenosylcobinamide-phosphate synthase CbiB [Phascolarctobacterium sp.]